MTLILKSIEKEAADCRARCASMKVGDLILHCHHETLLERLTEPAEDCINYILQSKTDNVALRLRLMGPPIVEDIVLSDAEWKRADAERERTDAELKRTYAEWKRIYAKCERADAEWKRTYAECERTYEPHYARLYPDSPWNGKTIFAGEFAL